MRDQDTIEEGVEQLMGAPSAQIGGNPDRPLTGGLLLAHNTVWNLIGTSAPTLAAVFCIPILIHGLGKDRFGLLTLAWALVGYASLFDLGLGRALTQLVASKLGMEHQHEIPGLVWTCLGLMLLMGLVGVVLVVFLTPWLVHRLLNVPSGLQQETIWSFYLLALSVPVVICTAGLRGLLEAQQRFPLINALRIPMGVLNFVGPLLVLPFTKKLSSVVAVLVVVRIAGCVAHLLFCLRIMPALRQQFGWHRVAVGSLLRFGGWMTVTNIIGPLMVTLDRFLIGSMISITAVTYYATPYEFVTKIWLIPGALVGVMFPAFSTSFAKDRNQTAALYGRSVKYLGLLLFPVILLVIAFAHDILRIWLGAEFAAHSTLVLQWLAIGVFLNSLAQVPFALIQGIGRPDLTAKLHLLELPAYLMGLWWLMRTHGIQGAAAAWTLRASVDTLVLFAMAGRFLRSGVSISRKLVLAVVIPSVLAGAASLVESLALRVILFSVLLSAFALAAWFLILTAEERTLVQRQLGGSNALS